MLKLYFPRTNKRTLRPTVILPIPAGEPMQAEYAVEWVDLDEYVQRGSDTVYYIHVEGDSMQDMGIFHGDLLVVDRTRRPQSGEVVLAEINGGYTIKKFKHDELKRQLHLVPANGKYRPKEIKKSDNFEVWGVITHVLHKL